MTALAPHTRMPAAPLDDTAFREAMSSFCTGVAVITATQPDGRPAGMAVQSFSSVSLDPPLVCFCPASTSSTWPKLRAAGRFAVNVLAADQRELCRQFAVTGGDKFTGVGWTPGRNGAPLLDGALATIECDLAGTFPGGDHVIALGRVTALTTADHTADHTAEHTADRTAGHIAGHIADPTWDSGPLLYFRRTYGRLRSSSSRSASIASARSRSEA